MRLRGVSGLEAVGVAAAATECSQLFFSPVVVNCYYVIIQSFLSGVWHLCAFFAFVFLSLYFDIVNRVRMMEVAPGPTGNDSGRLP